MELIDEQPLVGKEDDLLFFPAYAKILADAILSETHPGCIGVFGEWGTGKSSLLGLIKEDLTTRDNSPICIWFNAWAHQQEEHRQTASRRLVRPLRQIGHEQREMDEQHQYSGVHHLLEHPVAENRRYGEGALPRQQKRPHRLPEPGGKNIDHHVGDGDYLPQEKEGQPLEGREFNLPPPRAKHLNRQTDKNQRNEIPDVESGEGLDEFLSVHFRKGEPQADASENEADGDVADESCSGHRCRLRAGSLSAFQAGSRARRATRQADAVCAPAL